MYCKQKEKHKHNNNRQQSRNNLTFLEWLKLKWDGKLPLATGGSGGQSETPFIDISTPGAGEVRKEQP
jgi:hypothetical protein